MKKKILIFHPSLAPYRIDFFNYLKREHNIKVCFFRRNLRNQNFDTNALSEQLLCDHSFLSTGISLGSRVIWRSGIVKTIFKFRPEIIVIHEYSPINIVILIIARFLQISVILWSAENEHVFENDSKPRKILKFFFYSHINGIITYTPKVKSLLLQKKLFLRDQIGVYSNIQNNRHRQKSEDFVSDTPCISGYHYDQSRKVVIYVGRLAEEKNIDYLIRRKQQHSMVGLDYDLLIVGDGSELQSLKKLRIELDCQNIYFLGQRVGNKLSDIYQIADLLVLPSTYEPYGAVVAEALDMGVPVVCSKYAGASHLISDYQNGVTFDPKDIDTEKFDFSIEIFLNCTFRENWSDIRHSLLPRKFEDYAASWLPPKFKG